jgi:predicted nucleic acid-binding protein
MSRVFWDSMLFIYVVEDDPKYAPVVRDLLGRCFRRGDTLYTSHLSIAETLVGVPPGSEKELQFLATLQSMGFNFLEFGWRAVEPFRRLRREFGLKPPDSMHLACAAAIQTDIFLTGDVQLLKKRLHVPGIQFIADFESAPL